MTKYILFVKIFSGIVTFGVVSCGLADAYFSISNEMHKNPHLFNEFGYSIKILSYSLLFIVPVFFYAIGQYIMKGSLWASILGLLCIFIASSTTYSIYFVGGDPSMGMIIVINIICYGLVGIITFVGSLFYLNKMPNKLSQSNH